MFSCALSLSQLVPNAANRTGRRLAPYSNGRFEKSGRDPTLEKRSRQTDFRFEILP